MVRTVQIRKFVLVEPFQKAATAAKGELTADQPALRETAVLGDPRLNQAGVYSFETRKSHPEQSHSGF